MWASVVASVHQYGSSSIGQPLRPRSDLSVTAPGKTERTARKVYRTRDNASADVFDYFERFDNPRRRHSTLGYLSPVEYEEKAKRA